MHGQPYIKLQKLFSLNYIKFRKFVNKRKN